MTATMYEVLWGTKDGEDEHRGWVESPRMTYDHPHQVVNYIESHRDILDREPFVETWRDGVSLHIEDYKTWSMPPRYRRNLTLIKDFILYWTDNHAAREDMNASAEAYIKETYVDEVSE